MSDRKRKLLFVDDEPNILEMLSRILEHYGENWDVTLCLGVDEALDALRHAEFDTVITDIRMPKRDGFALIEEMRLDASLRNIPIIVHSHPIGI